MLTFEVAIRRLARSARMSHDGQRRVALHDRPDIRLHPMSITVIVYFPADIREESIYPRLSTVVVARLSPGGERSGSICPLRVSRRLTGGYAPMVPLDAWRAVGESNEHS